MIRNEQSIRALIQLVDDPDDAIYNHVRESIIQLGTSAIPFLETSWDDERYGLIYQERIAQLLHEIQYEDVKQQLKRWVDSPEKDLIEAAVCIARYQHPGIGEEIIRATLEQIRKDIWLELNDQLTAFEQVKILNHVFFETFKFHGDTKNYHDPSNSFIDLVLSNRKGNPLSLSLIYSYIAQSLGIPIYGVNLPNHFILAYLDENGSNKFLANQNEFGVLFYLNPFSKGSILDANAIKDFLNGMHLPATREYFEPCSNTTIIRRMLTNLISSFQEVGNADKVNELIELRDLLD